MKISDWLGAGLLAGMAVTATAAEPDIYDFYVGGALGIAKGAVGSDDMNNRMADLGYEANAEVTNRNRSAWNLNVGYRWNPYWEVQVGYTDLGEVRTRLSGNAVDINDYLNSANLVHPRSGSGYELALLGRYPLDDKSYVFGRGGIFSVDSRYRADDQNTFASRRDDDRTTFFGVGYGYEFSERLGARLTLDRYSVEDETIPVVALGVIYKFNSFHSSKKPTQVAAVPVPEPISTPVAQPVEPVKPILTAPVSIKLAVTFDTDSAVIKEQYMSEIIKLADFMNKYSNTRVTLEGHTDNRGNDAYNKLLSMRRAQAVHDALVARGGIAAERVSSIGYGEERPVADNTTDAGRAENRRVMAEISTQQ